MRINLLAAGLMALLIGPAVAAEEFFVVQNLRRRTARFPTQKMRPASLDWNVGVGRFSAKNDARK